VPDQSGVIQTDLLVVGAGVNGAGIAADAAGRGLSVVLCDQADIGGATSSSSTKLIHGGLRYLETWQFKLVHESLEEREVLLRAAPHIIWPMRFRLPHHKQLRPAWMIRIGLFLYDHLARRVTLPGSRSISFSDDGPLRSDYRRGFEYSDCWVDDSRLVILNALQAASNGAQVLPRHRCVNLTAQQKGKQGRWLAELLNERSGEVTKVSARCVVNAAGPWVTRVLTQSGTDNRAVRLVKGSHIVVPRMHPGEEAFLLQNADGRVVFVIPYEDDYTLIGTTEEDYAGDPADAKISSQEIEYLCDVVNQYFKRNISTADVVHTYAGVRPLVEEESDKAAGKSASKVSRDYSFQLDRREAPLLTVYGGKITTYRHLAESALRQLREIFPDMGEPWTRTANLPGGDFTDQASLLSVLQQEHPALPAQQIAAWVKRYGTSTRKLLDGVNGVADLGRQFGPGLYAREVDYLIAKEWAMTADDILWRRTKLGIRFTQEQVLDLEGYMARDT